MPVEKVGSSADAGIRVKGDPTEQGYDRAPLMPAYLVPEEIARQGSHHGQKKGQGEIQQSLPGQDSNGKQ